MSELDKYFEKARNVEPIYEEDDAKKLLYGKLSDGGIATNLYNKIKVYPMIATLITSVATIATIALLSISSPNTKVAQTSIKNTTEIIDNKDERSNEKPEDLDWTEKKQPTNQSSVALLSEEKEELNKKPKALNWTEEKIDIKSVNTLKLTKDELAKLGIEIDSKSFKVNAFDKYTYTINQKNEKTRDYYNNEEDRDALPTPAMVTTSTGFKTLTLFKKGNVEATVDRYRSESEDGKLAEQTISVSEYDLERKFEDAPRFNMNEQSFEEYQQSLSGHKDSAAIIQEMENIELFEVETNGKKTTIEIQKLLNAANNDDKEMLEKIMKEAFTVDQNKQSNKLDVSVSIKRKDEKESDRIVDFNIEIDSNQLANVNTVESQLKDFISKSKYNNSDLQELPDDVLWALDSILENNNIDISPHFSNGLKNNAYIKDLLLRENDDVNVVMLNSESTVLDGELVKSIDERNIEVYTTDMNRKDVDAIIKATLDSLASKNTTLIEVEATEETSSNDPNNKTIYMPLESLEEGKKLIINKIETNAEFEIEDGKSDLEFKLKPGQTVWADENQDGTNKAFVSNMSFDFINYNINELIPIEISFDGVNTDFIVWYEATEEFLTKLPSNLLEKINPELAAISDQAQHCDNAPIEKDNAVMDVWSGCSGAIKEMKVYPNPVTSNSNVEFDLDDNRIISIAVYDLSGKLIKSVKSGMALDKGSNSRSLNLNGVNPGLYYVVVKSDRGEQALQRIVIE